MTVALDASAILALLRREAGHKTVHATLGDALVSAVNYSEVVAKLADSGMPLDAVADALDSLGLTVVDFDRDQGWSAGEMRPARKRTGLSLGDRACLALAKVMGVPAMTADRAWAGLDLGVEIEVIR